MPHPPPPAWTLPDPWLVGGLRLRPATPADVPALVAAVDDEVRRHTLLPTPFTVEDAEEVVALGERAHATRTGVRVVVTDADDDTLLGWVGLFIAWGDGEAEVGYWLAPAARGRGVASTAVREVCRFGFAIGLGRLGLRATAANPGSNRLAERLGFRREGLLRLAGIDGPTGDLTAPRVDMITWGLLPGELAGGR